MIETPEAIDADALPTRVLVVEADPNESERTRTMLETCASIRFETDQAVSFEEAARKIKDERFDAVLLSLRLPDTAGEETLLRFRVLAWSVPVVVTIEADQEALAFKSLRFGAQDFLVKQTWEGLSLVRTLRSAIERHRLLSELTEARRREYLRATHDGLTGLPNRAYFQDQLGRLLAYASRHEKFLAVLFIDLNRFKKINDSMGHQVGDEILKAAGERLSSVIRRSDLAARLGGDEFVVVAQDISREHDPATVARKVLAALSEPCAIEGREYRITGSIGIAVFPRDGTDGETLIRNADAAMYHAKAQGCSQYRFYAEHLNAYVAETLDLESELHGVVERKELVLYYEPKIDPSSGQVVGAEAAVHWSHPERGLLAADEFMPAAQGAGAIVEIGHWALRQACEDLREWNRTRSAPLSVAVKVEESQLRQKGFADTLAHCVRQTGIEPEWLEIVVSEKCVREPGGPCRGALLLLRKLGVRILIDDFEAGVSSLLEIRRLSVAAVKLGRSTVAGVGGDAAKEAIVQALIGVGRAFGLAIGAGGVETWQECTFLRDRGCRTLQGPLFGGRLRAEEFASKARASAQATRGGASEDAV